MTDYPDYVLAWFDDNNIDPNGPDAEDEAMNAEDAFVGKFSRFRDYADEVADDLLPGVDGIAARYFDYEAFAFDLEMDYAVLEAPDEAAVFIYRY